MLLLEACSARLAAEVLTLVRAEHGEDIRTRDGYVFQHLVPGPQSVSELARRLGVTQQAMSKQVDDLVRRSLVAKHRDPTDARARLVALADRGNDVVEAGRRARTSIEQQLIVDLGSTAVAALREQLTMLSDETGALTHLMNRRLRPEDTR